MSPNRPVRDPPPVDKATWTATRSLAGDDPEQAGTPITEPSLPPPGTVVGQYELIREIGRGGMGTVFRARDIRLGRLVAIKFLDRLEGRMARFLTEARATASCRHENIVVIFDIGHHEGRPYMVLEYLGGQTLRQWLEQRDVTSAAHAARLLIPVARALACAHDAGIIHRDLKPENIMLTDAGAIKVLDFGVARLMGPDPAAPHEIAHGGTAAYMAPEQRRGDDADFRTDLYALGVILHELVYGSRPSAEGRVSGDAAIDTVIAGCLAADPDERTPSTRALLEQLEAFVPASRNAADDPDTNPYPGLAAFQSADETRFFGRATEVAALVARLRSRALLAVTGPSGAGKSSFVRAGVIPILERSGESWDSFVLRPGRRPLDALAAVTGQLETISQPTAADLPEGGRPQPGALGARLRAHARATGRRVLVFVDQFEELYTLGISSEDRAMFVSSLEGAADDASSPVRVLLAVRSDFLDRATVDLTFSGGQSRGVFVLPPLDPAGLREALEGPLQARGFHFENPATVEAILDSLANTRGPLPLLQATAHLLWESRDRARRIITDHSYDALGGVGGALATHADAALGALPVSAQKNARVILQRLVTADRTRALVPLDELLQLGTSPQDLRAIVTHLTAERLIVVDSPGAEAAAVELAHDALIEGWPTLRRWLDDDRDALDFVAKVRGAAQQWHAAGRSSDLLWRGDAATDARRLWERLRADARKTNLLNSREEDFLAAVGSLAARARRRRTLLTVGGAALLVVTAVVLAYANHQTSKEAARARNATRLAVARELESDPTTALTLLREMEPGVVPAGWSQLAQRALHAGSARWVFEHPAAVEAVAVDPSGRWLATGCADGVVRMWRIDGSEPTRELDGHTGMVRDVRFSRDGRHLVSASADATARVWDAGTGRTIATLAAHRDRVNAASFSPDGTQVATVSYDGTVRLWPIDDPSRSSIVARTSERINGVAFAPDGNRLAFAASQAEIVTLDGSRPPLVLPGHGDPVESVAFSPDGRHVVTSSWDHHARIFAADGTGVATALRGHQSRVYAASYGPRGERIVTASVDGTARVWDRLGNTLVELGGHHERVYDAAFDHSGARIVTASRDATARIWDLEVPERPSVYRGHGRWVYAAVFSPDGRRFASSSDDRSVRVTDFDDPASVTVLEGHTDRVYSVAFHPDGRQLASASVDGTVRLWDLADPTRVRVLRGHTARVYSVDFSPDGSTILSTSADRTARIWPTRGSGTSAVIALPDRAYRGVFSPDGARFATALRDGSAQLWSAASGEALAELCCHEALVESVAFSPDGQLVGTASWDTTARIWRVDSAPTFRVLAGHQGPVEWVDFSPDGLQVVTASADKTARIWSVTGAGKPVVLAGHDSWVQMATFSPDGERVLTASEDLTVRLWRDLEALTLSDPRLWERTHYCPSPHRRRDLLGIPVAMAEEDFQRCVERVRPYQSNRRIR